MHEKYFGYFGILASHPTAPGSIPCITKNFRGKNLSMTLKIINGTGWRKLDSGLKMLIELILFWRVASQFYKNRILKKETVHWLHFSEKIDKCVVYQNIFTPTHSENLGCTANFKDIFGFVLFDPTD